MPGLKESLDVDSDDFDGDVDIPDYIEVTADVEDFSLEMTMSAVVNALQTAWQQTAFILAIWMTRSIH